MIKKIKNTLASTDGFGYIEIIAIIMVTMMLIALAIRVYPVFITKMNMDTFAQELVRVAEVEGRIGKETTAKEKQLQSVFGIKPKVEWSKKGAIQLSEEFSVIISYDVNIGFWEFGSIPITLKSKASGRSEVYQK